MADHERWLADQLRTKQIDDLHWCDTRDTRADPVTKGSMGRELILSAMDGQISYEHATVKFSDEKLRKANPTPQQGSLSRK
eukprot:3549547-Pyramimonas_sp.AAC.1